MNEQDSNLTSQRLDEAVAQRLAKLRSMPVDTSRLAKLVEAQIPRPAAGGPHSRFRLTEWMRPLRAVAASVLILGLIAASIISSSSGPVLASTQDLLRVHQEMLAGTNHAMPVQSIDGANGAIAQEWPKAPQLPQVPHDQVMSCCVHRVGRQEMACAAMKIDGISVSMAVADAADIKMPPGQTIQRGGATYQVESTNGVNMVMTQRNGRWACLMGEVPTEKLLNVLEGLKW